MPRTFKVVAISHSPGDVELIRAGKKKAKGLRKSFSAYVCELIERDLASVSSAATAEVECEILDSAKEAAQSPSKPGAVGQSKPRAAARKGRKSNEQS